MEGLKQEEFLQDAKRFFQSYSKKIGESVRKTDNVVYISFEDLSEHSPSISELLLDSPVEITTKLELALSELGIVKNPRISQGKN